MSGDAAGILDVLYTHAIEGTYCHPGYGGNANRSGWTEIKFPGESQPRGTTPRRSASADGLDPIDPTGVIAMVLGDMEAAALRLARRPGGR